LDQPAVRWLFGDANGAGQQSRTPVAALPPAMKTRLELTICRSRRHFHSPFPLTISTAAVSWPRRTARLQAAWWCSAHCAACTLAGSPHQVSSVGYWIVDRAPE
jgi:hypothetical protein